MLVQVQPSKLITKRSQKKVQNYYSIWHVHQIIAKNWEGILRKMEKERKMKKMQQKLLRWKIMQQKMPKRRHQNIEAALQCNKSWDQQYKTHIRIAWDVSSASVKRGQTKLCSKTTKKCMKGLRCAK